MFAYVSLGTNDVARATRFYDAALAPLGLARCEARSDAAEASWAGWGRHAAGGSRQVSLWVCQPFDGRPASAGNGTMVALPGDSWDQVDGFHAAALAHGGTSEGAPGLRPHYGADFYAAYVRDPDGNKLAAVCRGFATRQASEAAARARSRGNAGLDHVHIFASDLAATVDFFRRMLGAAVVWDEPAAGVRNVRLALGRGHVHVYDQPPRRERGGAIHHLGVATDDLEGLVARMREAGFAFRNPIRDDGAFRYVMIAGPDDLLIELFECREPVRWGIRD